MRTTWTFHSAGRIVFGIDAVESLGDHLLELTEESSRVLIVTDPALVDAGVCERVREALRESGIESTVFDGGCPEPPLELAMTCAEAARAAGAGWLLGLGGGSNMDLAKVTACVLAHGGDPRDYLGDCVVPGPVFPLACVPTTAGTGSEVTAASVLSDPERGIKVAVLSDFLRPRLSVVDPRLTVSCPQHVTADSGAVRYVRGSHKWGRQFEPVGSNDVSRHKLYEGRSKDSNRPDELEDMPDIDAVVEPADIACFETKPGDVVVHDVLTIHSSPGNDTNRRRRALGLRFAGEQATYAVRQTKLNIRPMIDPELKHGDPFPPDPDHHVFPQVWPNAT